MSCLQRLSLRTWFTANLLVLGVQKTLAQGLGPLPNIGGPANTDVRTTIVNILKFVLNFMALIAVIFIIIAGIRLIVSQGEEDQKEKAKKTIIYVVIGLLVILFARVIVEFVTDVGTSGFAQ
jgi:type IV secretory pathway VirB2 component (pilin)